MDPTFVKGYYRLAAAQIELKDHNGAVATIRQGLTIDSNNPQLSKQMRIVQQQIKVALAKSQAPPPAAVMRGEIDPTTATELQDLQTQYAQSSRELNAVQTSLVKSQHQYKVAELTQQELQQAPDSANCYRSIGKMFLRSSKQGLVEHLTGNMELEQKNEADMTRKLDYLQRQMTSLRQNIDELISPGTSVPTE